MSADQSDTKIANLLNLDDTTTDFSNNKPQDNKENIALNVKVEKNLSPTSAASPVKKQSTRTDLYKLTLANATKSKESLEIEFESNNITEKFRTMIDNLWDEDISLVDSIDSDSDLDDLKIPFLQKQEKLKMDIKKSEVISKLNNIKKNSNIPEKSDDLKEIVTKLKEIVMTNANCDAQTKSLMDQLSNMIEKQTVDGNKSDEKAQLVRQNTFDLEEPTLVRLGAFDKDKEVDSGCESSSFLSSSNSSSENTHQLSKALGNVNLNVLQMNHDSAVPAKTVVVNQNDLAPGIDNSPLSPVKKSSIRRSQSFKPVMKNQEAKLKPPVLTRSLSFTTPNPERRRSLISTHTPVLPRKSFMPTGVTNGKCPPLIPPQRSGLIKSTLHGNKPGLKTSGPMKATIPVKPVVKPQETFSTPQKQTSRFPLKTPSSNLVPKTQPIAQSTPMTAYIGGTPTKNNRTSLIPPNSSNIQRRSLVSTPTRPQPARPVSGSNNQTGTTGRRPSLGGRPQSFTSVPTTRTSMGLSRLSFFKSGQK